MIRLLDSLQMIKGSLENILKSFNCKIRKGNFPYSFVNKDNLYYKGLKPEFKFYTKILTKEYNLIPRKNWNLDIVYHLKKEMIIEGVDGRKKKN